MSEKQQEGQLYKKLYPFADKVEGEYGTCLGNDAATVELQIILDEVKADYLLAAPKDQSADNSPDFWLKLVNEHNAWFKKWFGATP